MNNQLNLKKSMEYLAKRIRNAKNDHEYFENPFKHIVIDDAFPLDLANEALRNFPDLNSDLWEFACDHDIEIKYRSKWQSEFDIPEFIVDIVRILNSSEFLRALSDRIGIAKIVPDPYFTGGGLNVTTRGGLLDVHVDGNYHDATGLNRRLNALLYLNPGWEKSWGGEFGIYNNDGTICEKKVDPIHNRLVIFDSHDFSYHGLPEPVNFPLDYPRRSILLYYYTKESRPSSQVSIDNPHSALWIRRGLVDKRGNKTRDYT